MCFLILDDYGKEIKKGAKAAGLDMAAVKKWLKYYVKVKKKVPVVVSHFQRVREDVAEILERIKILEQDLILVREEGTKLDNPKELAAFLKKKKPCLDCQFVVAQEDIEIISTMESITRLLAEYDSGKVDPVLIQSETENLIFHINESQEKKRPRLFELAAFYVNHSDQELKEMPCAKQLEKVHEIYLEEFERPIRPVLEAMKGTQAEAYLRSMTGL